jgi:hypothetical protein
MHSTIIVIPTSVWKPARHALAWVVRFVAAFFIPIDNSSLILPGF